MLGPIIGILWLLFYLGVIVAVVFVILWFLQTILGLPLPQRAIQVIWGLVGLLVIIYLLMFLSQGGLHLPGLRG
jgi:hypothetical protein